MVECDRKRLRRGGPPLGMETVAVTDRRAVGPDAVALSLAAPAGFDARPGQFVKLTLATGGEDVSRFYTVSSPHVEESVEVTVEIDPEGDLGPHLAALEVGDEIGMDGPFGSAAYEGEPRTLVLAGGPGVGPAVAIAERTLDDGGEAAVVYRDEEPIHADRLAALRERGATVLVLGGDAPLAEAVADAIERFETAPQVFVYGFAPFLDDATAALSAAGADAERAKVESFGPAPGT